MCHAERGVRKMKTLSVYGPGGPYLPMRECAEGFNRAGGVRVEVTKGTPQQWFERAGSDADLIYGGAEYMLDDFMDEFPGMIDPATITCLHARIVGVIVRKGNPRRIGRLADLASQQTRVLNVELEKMAELQDRIPGIRDNIAVSVLTGEQGAQEWISNPALDAWITYQSWNVQLRDHSDFVRLPEAETLYRHTPIALTNRTLQKETALAFIRYLQSAAGREVFFRWGWTDPKG